MVMLSVWKNQSFMFVDHFGVFLPSLLTFFYWVCKVLKVIPEVVILSDFSIKACQVLSLWEPWVLPPLMAFPRCRPWAPMVSKPCLTLHLFFWSFCLFLSRSPAAYGGSQARGPVGAVAAGLRQSHSNAGSEPCLWPTPQLTATPDP